MARNLLRKFMNDANIAKRETEVSEILGRIAAELERSSMLKDRLAGRLDVVCRPQSLKVDGRETADKAPTEREYSAPLANRLNELFKTLRGLNDSHDDIINRVEV